MHDCMECGQTCDCDGEDTWLSQPADCDCDCDTLDDDDLFDEDAEY